MSQAASAPAPARSGPVPALVAVLTLAFALFTAGSYFWAPCRAGVIALLQLSVLVLIATGSGRALLSLLGFTDVSDSQMTLLGCTLGLGILSLGLFALAALHALSLAAVAALLTALWLVGFTEMRDVLRSLASNRNLLGERPVATSLIFGFLAITFWLTWVPPHQYDSLVYHLPLAQAYVTAGGFVSVPGTVYMHFPQNGEMLFALALVLKSDILAQMFMWLALVLSVWWIFELGRREAPLSAVLLACLLLVTHTSVMLLSSISYVESLVMLWTTAATLSFLRWEQVSAADSERRSWLVLSALFTGLALGTKYYAGITAVVLFGRLALRWARGRVPRPSAGFDALLYAAIVTAVFLPWMIKNAVMAGNPLYPFFNYLFPGATQGGLSQSLAKGYFNQLTEYRNGGSAWLDFAQLPVMLLTNSTHFGKGMDVLGGLGWELTFWSMPLAVWASWRNRFLRSMLYFCGLYFVGWFFTGVVLRFLLALAPLLSLLAGCGLYALWQRLGRGGRFALGGAVGVAGLTHLLLFFFVELGVFGAGGLLVGMEGRDDFLSRKLDYYSCARWAQDHLGKNDRILIVGEQRSYFVAQDHVASTVQGPNRFVAWANASASPRELASKIRQDGFSDILFVPREMVRLGAQLGQFTEAGAKNWAGLDDRMQPLFRGNACTLYSIK